VPGATGYVLERSHNGLDYTVISSAPASFTSHRDSGTTYSKRWFYRIHSTGPGGTRSAPSAPIRVTSKPAAPAATWGYTTPDVIWNSSEVFINWIDTHGEGGYRLDVSTDGVSYRFDRNVPANSTAANFDGLLPGRRYWFKVTPTSPIGDGVPLVIASQTRLGALENLRLTSRSPTSMSLAWNDAGSEDGYRVERSTDGVDWTFLGDTPRDVTTWTDNNLAPGSEYYYRVVQWNGIGRGDWGTVMAATPAASIPAGWASRDIGAVAGPGTAVNTGTGTPSGAWKLISGGGDVFGAADAFHFAYQPVVGDASIVARVDGVERTHDAAKAGLMIRQDFSAGGRFAAVMLNAGGGWGIDVRSRTATGANATYQQARANVAAPYWLKLTRTGGTVTAAYSADGVTFTNAATIDLPLNGTFYVGLANTSASTTLLNTSTFGNVAVQGRPPASVQGRWTFYNGSALDGSDPAPSAADDAAIAADKVALRPGAAATFANVTNSPRGITGVMVDLANLPAAASPTVSDFVLETRAGSTWAPVPAAAFARRPITGTPGLDRMTLTLPDGTAARTWLRVTVKANANTGLSSPDVFYFGNLPGDTGGRGTPTVDAADLARTRAAVGRTTPAALATYDFNRDGTINAADVLIVRTNQRRSLPLFTAPAATGAASWGTTSAGTVPSAPTRAPSRPTRRGVLDDPPSDLLA
jgi:hypothetical protein